MNIILIETRLRGAVATDRQTDRLTDRRLVRFIRTCPDAFWAIRGCRRRDVVIVVGERDECQKTNAHLT